MYGGNDLITPKGAGAVLHRSGSIDGDHTLIAPLVCSSL
jgi:hypothetical protein